MRAPVIFENQGGMLSNDMEFCNTSELARQLELGQKRKWSQGVAWQNTAVCSFRLPFLELVVALFFRFVRKNPILILRQQRKSNSGV